MSVISEGKRQGLVLNTAASSGITWTAPDNGNISVVETGDGIWTKSVITVPAFSFAVTAAALAIGQKLATFPEGHIHVVGGHIAMTSTSTTAAGTAGEIGLGTTLGTGAVATLGAVAATAEDIVGPTTLANHVAGTQLSTAAPLKAGADGSAQVFLDGSATAKTINFNIASTWDNTGSVSIDSLVVTLLWANLADD